MTGEDGQLWNDRVFNKEYLYVVMIRSNKSHNVK